MEIKVSVWVQNRCLGNFNRRATEMWRLAGLRDIVRPGRFFIFPLGIVSGRRLLIIYLFHLRLLIEVGVSGACWPLALILTLL